MASEHPAMELARRGPRGKVDKFLALWLALLADGRQARFESGRSRTRRTIERFFSEPDVQAAWQQLGDQALAAELTDAACLYFRTCMTDPNYSTWMFGTKRLEPARLVQKAAQEAAGAIAVILESGRASGMAARLPDLLAEGFLREIGPESAADLRSALVGHRLPSDVVDRLLS